VSLDTYSARHAQPSPLEAARACAAARCRDLPIIKIRNRVLVSRVGLEQMLREAMPKATNDDERVGR
jgi:hypothetical protein